MLSFLGVFSGTESEWKDYLNTIWFSKFWRRFLFILETILIFKYPQRCTTGPGRRWAPVDLSMFSLANAAREVSQIQFSDEMQTIHGFYLLFSLTSPPLPKQFDVCIYVDFYFVSFMFFYTWCIDATIAQSRHWAAILVNIIVQVMSGVSTTGGITNTWRSWGRLTIWVTGSGPPLARRWR